MPGQLVIPTVVIPGKAVGNDAANDGDISKPTVDLLGNLNLLPSNKDLELAGTWTAGLQGPPQSVALIEASATALSKWWAAGLGATVLGAWGAVQTFWGDNPAPTQRVMLLAAAIASAAIVLAIGYLLASDIRGRAAASVATIEARARVATSMIAASERASSTPPPPPPPDAANGGAVAQASAVPVNTVPAAHTVQVIPLPAAIPARWVVRESPDEGGWTAIALRIAGETTSYWLAKGPTHAWVLAGDVRLAPVPPSLPAATVTTPSPAPDVSLGSKTDTPDDTHSEQVEQS